MNDHDPFVEMYRVFAELEADLGLGTGRLVNLQEGVTYVLGSTVPLLGGPSVNRSDPLGLRVPGSLPASDDYIGTFITLAEYMPEAATASLQDAADQHRREDLITALVALNRMRENSDQLREMTAEYLKAIPPWAAETLTAQLKVATGGMGRRLVAPQPLLSSIRWLLTSKPLSMPIERTTSPLHAVRFSHLVASQGDDGASGPISDTDEAFMKRLMLVMMNLGMLGEQDDIFASIHRTIKLWEVHGDAAVAHSGLSATELFLQEVGLEIRDVMALGFAFLGQALAWKPGQPMSLPHEIHPDLPERLTTKALALFCRSLDDHFVSSAMPVGDFDNVALESFPVLDLPAGLLVLDEQFMHRRFTSGLFWMLHDRLKSRSEDAATRFRISYGLMIERLVKDSLETVAPPTLGGSRSYFTEDDLESAYGQTPRCDMVIDFGDSFMLTEVVSGQISVQSRVHGDLDKLGKDIDRLVLEKCKQLDGVAQNLAKDEYPLTGIASGTRFPALVPVLVVGGGFPINVLSMSFLRHKIDAMGYFSHARVERLSIVDLNEVEQLEALAEQGESPVAILQAWQRSDLSDVPFRNFLLREYSGRVLRPARISDGAQTAFDDVIARLGFQRDPPP